MISGHAPLVTFSFARNNFFGKKCRFLPRALLRFVGGSLQLVIMLEPHDLPDDLHACQRMLLDLSAAHQRLQQIHEELLATCTSMEETHGKLAREKQELEETIKELMNRLYGRRSEKQKFSPDQLSLDFGEADVVQVLPDVTEDEQFVAEHERKKRRRKRKKRRGRFPEHLERRSERVEPDLPAGVRREDCELLGVDVVEILEFERPRLWVRRIEYPKYKIPSRPELQIMQGTRLAGLIPGGSFGFGIAAEVLHGKFALHVPLYRQQDPLSELGWAPNRSSLCQIVAHGAELLSPLAALMTQRVLSSHVINTDDTQVTLLTPGQEAGSRKAPCGSIGATKGMRVQSVSLLRPAGREAGPDEFLRDFEGTICGDCYSGYVNIEDVTDGRIVFSACNTHAPLRAAMRTSNARRSVARSRHCTTCSMTLKSVASDWTPWIACYCGVGKVLP